MKILPHVSERTMGLFVAAEMCSLQLHRKDCLFLISLFNLLAIMSRHDIIYNPYQASDITIQTYNTYNIYIHITRNRNQQFLFILLDPFTTCFGPYGPSSGEPY
jgi:hypothetical protein